MCITYLPRSEKNLSFAYMEVRYIMERHKPLKLLLLRTYSLNTKCTFFPMLISVFSIKIYDKLYLKNCFGKIRN